MKYSKLIIATAALSVASVSMAANSTAVAPTSKTGLYLSGDLGFGGIHNTKSIKGLHNKKTGFVWNATAGYKLNPYFAVEGGYLQAATRKYSDTFGTNKADVEANLGLFNILAKGMYPVMSNLDVFAKAGVGYTYKDTDVTINGYTINSSLEKKDNFVPIIGGGADYYVTKNIAATAQLLYSFQRGSDKSMKTPPTLNGLVGLSYSF
jgi:OmpA-OmpF porin, OOP family